MLLTIQGHGVIRTSLTFGRHTLMVHKILFWGYLEGGENLRELYIYLLLILCALRAKFNCFDLKQSKETKIYLNTNMMMVLLRIGNMSVYMNVYCKKII